MSEELKPCPFCGSKRIKAHDVGEGWWCICQDCKAQGPFKMLENTAVDAWNRRAGVKGDADAD